MLASLSPTRPLLGRWGPRDFLRGRSKKGGAIHIRHTHGSKGRYKRLSDIHGIRDGRRHASNHTQGGLGIKLGGGLFGLRIPRQHKLSTLTREEFDLQIYGHPNITNPYREMISEHPQLREVMENAKVCLRIIALMPRVARTNSGAPLARWSAFAEDLQSFLASVGQHAEVDHVCLGTLDTSVTVAPGSTPEEMNFALHTLFAEHQNGRRLRAEQTDPEVMRSRKAALLSKEFMPFMGDCLRVTPKALTQAGSTSYASPTLHFVKFQTESALPLTSTEAGSSCTGTASSPDGVFHVLRDIRKGCPDTLCVCVRPLAEDHCNNPTPSTPLLKKDVQVDEEEGVWAQPRNTISELLRWSYSNRDPRAHSCDAVPHRARRLHVLILVDASKTPTARSETGLAPSLLSRQRSEELQRLGFKPLERTSSLSEIAQSLRRWSVSSSWEEMLRLQERSPGPVLVETLESGRVRQEVNCPAS